MIKIWLLGTLLLFQGTSNRFDAAILSFGDRNITILLPDNVTIGTTLSEAIQTTKEIDFDGDWKGVNICYNSDCRLFEDIFKP